MYYTFSVGIVRAEQRVGKIDLLQTGNRNQIGGRSGDRATTDKRLENPRNEPTIRRSGQNITNETEDHMTVVYAKLAKRSHDCMDWAIYNEFTA